MKKVQFVAVLFLAFFTACAESASNTSANYASTSSDSTSKGNLLGGGGGGGREKGIGSGSGNGSGTGDQTLMGEMEPNSQQVSLTQAEQTQTAPTVIERKIIRNADLELESSSPEESAQKITQIAESVSGFVVESAQTASDVKSAARDVVTMTVRVPAAKFDETIAAIRQTGTRTISETVKGQDVTEEFIDIEARLKTQKALEAQFVEIMKQAKTVEDALNVQSQLAEVRGEIEKVEGRRRFLENQASLSTLKIRLQTPTAIGASSNGFFYRLTDSLSAGFDFALNFLLGLVTFAIAIVPFLLFIGLPIYLIARYFLRKNRKRKTADEILKDEIK